jgi:hypothetical protein
VVDCVLTESEIGARESKDGDGVPRADVWGGAIRFKAEQRFEEGEDL